MNNKDTLTSDKVHEKLSRNTIDQGVVAFIKRVNMMCGSAGSIDLYSLLQTYLLDREKRDEINRIVKGK